MQTARTDLSIKAEQTKFFHRSVDVMTKTSSGKLKFFYLLIGSKVELFLKMIIRRPERFFLM